MWVPAEPAAAGQRLDLHYRLHWLADEPYPDRPRPLRRHAPRQWRPARPAAPQGRAQVHGRVHGRAAGQAALRREAGAGAVGLARDVLLHLHRGRCPTTCPAIGARSSTSPSRARTRWRCGCFLRNGGRGAERDLALPVPSVLSAPPTPLCNAVTSRLPAADCYVVTVPAAATGCRQVIHGPNLTLSARSRPCRTITPITPCRMPWRQAGIERGAPCAGRVADGVAAARFRPRERLAGAASCCLAAAVALVFWAWAHGAVTRTAIRFDDLTLGYDRHPAVHHLDGRVRRGQPDGHRRARTAPASRRCSRASSARCKPLAGRVTVCDAARQRIAYLPQAAEIDRSFPINVYDLVVDGPVARGTACSAASAGATATQDRGGARRRRPHRLRAARRSARCRAGRCSARCSRACCCRTPA